MLLLNPFRPFRVTSLLLLFTIHLLAWHPNSISGQGWADEDAEFDEDAMVNDVSLVSLSLSVPFHTFLYDKSLVFFSQNSSEHSSLTIDVLIFLF